MNSLLLVGVLFGLPGYMELIIVGGIALLLFGNRLPSVMRSLGTSIVEFKKGVKGIENDIEEATKEKTPSDAAGSEDRS